MEFHEIPRNIGNLARNTEVTEVQKQMEFRGHPKWDTQGPGETESWKKPEILKPLSTSL